MYSKKRQTMCSLCCQQSTNALMATHMLGYMMYHAGTSEPKNAQQVKIPATCNCTSCSLVHGLP